MCVGLGPMSSHYGESGWPSPALTSVSESGGAPHRALSQRTPSEERPLSAAGGAQLRLAEKAVNQGGDRDKNNATQKTFCCFNRLRFEPFVHSICLFLLKLAL